MDTKKLIENIFGYFVGCLIILLNQIQITKLIRTKNVSGFSFTYIFIYLIISILYLIIGILGEIAYIYIPNIICSVQQLILLLMYLYWKNNNKTDIDKLLNDDLSY